MPLIPGKVVDIPGFTISGVLPPYLGNDATLPAMMSPYATSLARIATMFCGSDERKEIFRGFLQYRRALAALGLKIGFQWLSGSFFEDIEATENRSPQDIDVITFLRRPSQHSAPSDWKAFCQANRQALSHGAVKSSYKCDAYFVDLGSQPDALVGQTRYWFGLFSHRRNGLWKGMLQVPLDVDVDGDDAFSLVRQ